MSLVSICLPSFRPDFVRRAIRQIQLCSRGVDYEIVVSSPFSVEGDNIVWLPEREKMGCVLAMKAACDAAKGDVIVTMNDDMAPTPGWLAGVFREIEEKEDKYFPYCGGLYFANEAIVGTFFGLYYPNLPIIGRRSFEAIGGLWLPPLRHHFCDADVGMRIWDQGGFCEPLPHRMVYRTMPESEDTDSDVKLSSFEHDAEIFYNKWYPKFGDRLESPDAPINKVNDVSHLYQHVSPEIYKQLVEG